MAYKRPVSIVIVALWSVLRALLAALTIPGTFIFLREAFSLWGHSLFEVWTVAPLTIKFSILQTIIYVIAFLILAVGIFRGFDWGRKGFIIVSALTFVVLTYWNLQEIFVLRQTPRVYLPLDSLLALCLAIWYFNKEDTLIYFQTGSVFPEWSGLYYKVRNYPITIVIVVAIVILRLFGEGLGLLSIL